MTKYSENETGLLNAFLLQQTKIRKEINISVLPSYNCLLAKGMKSSSTQFDQNRQKQKC